MTDAPEQIFAHNWTADLGTSESWSIGEWRKSGDEIEGMQSYIRADKYPNWKPIDDDTPRDGTPILLYRNRKGDKRVIPARWAEDIDSVYPWQGLCPMYGHNSYCDDYYMKKWMHLPEPPESDE